MRRIGSIALRWGVALVAFDLIGVALSFIFDVAPSRNTSSLLAYAVWLVSGVFCGLLGYSFACGAGPRAAERQPDYSRNGLAAVLVGITLTALLTLCFYGTMWRRGFEPDSYVPDNPGLTAAFFLSLTIAMVLAHTVFRPDARPPGQQG